MADPERRAPTRPHPGDVKPCPRCQGVMRFNEPHLIVRDKLVSDPTWHCQNPGCRWIERVRVTEE
jgi:hypothetical protein